MEFDGKISDLWLQEVAEACMHGSRLTPGSLSSGQCAYKTVVSNVGFLGYHQQLLVYWFPSVSIQKATHNWWLNCGNLLSRPSEAPLLVSLLFISGVPNPSL